jgi:hypothetical protein
MQWGRGLSKLAKSVREFKFVDRRLAPESPESGARAYFGNKLESDSTLGLRPNT